MDNKVSWRDVDVWHYGATDGRQDRMSEPDRVKALSEYRQTGRIWLGVLANPADYSGPDSAEALSAAGPEADEIDWDGFGASG